VLDELGGRQEGGGHAEEEVLVEVANGQVGQGEDAEDLLRDADVVVGEVGVDERQEESEEVVDFELQRQRGDGADGAGDNRDLVDVDLLDLDAEVVAVLDEELSLVGDLLQEEVNSLDVGAVCGVDPHLEVEVALQLDILVGFAADKVGERKDVAVNVAELVGPVRGGEAWQEFVQEARGQLE